MEVPLSCRRVQHPPTFIFIRVYITWQRRPQHQIKVTRKNLARNPSYKKTIWVSKILKGALTSTKDIGGPRIMDQPKTTIHLRDFDAHFCVLNFFRAFVFSVGMDVLVRICESCHSFHIYVYWGIHGQKWRGTSIKWLPFRVMDISNPSSLTPTPPPKLMLHFKPSSLSSTANNIDRIQGWGRGEGLTALNRIVWNEWNCW